MRLRVLLLLLCSGATTAWASGHGPVFGFATPVNSRGETSFDVGWFARAASGGPQSALKGMLSYGLTPHVQATVVVPVLLQQGALPMSMVSGGEFSGSVAWRFHHDANAVGRRFESTASVGIVAPGPQDDFGMFRGMKNAPGVNGWVATGVASRAHYFWLGGGITHFAERRGDQRPNVIGSSIVYGYRPPSWRADRHVWDWRVFAELSAEHVGLTQRGGNAMAGSDANQVFLGPSV